MKERHPQEDRQGAETIGTTTTAPSPPLGMASAARRDERAGVVLDTEKYRGLLADEALSADQEREYIETVWAILLQAMLLGIRLEFDAKSCGQDGGAALPPPISGGNPVEWDDQNFSQDFNSAAAEVRAAEGSEK